MLRKRSLSILALLATITLWMGVCEVMGQDSADNTFWKDSATGLTWTVKDNGSSVSPNEAGNYCRGLRSGGFSDWRLPTIDELEAVYDSKLKKEYKAKGPIKLSDPCVLSGTTNSSGTWTFCFNSGGRNLGGGSGCGTTGHVLCTRGPAR
jgi:hypothetical protein